MCYGSLREDYLSNLQIAELLAIAAESAKQPLQKALRRASRRAFLWPEEAAQLLKERRSLEEFQSVGPFLSNLIRRWVEDPPEVPHRPEIRRGFFTLTEVRSILEAEPDWRRDLKGDLQMHSLWSDGEGSIQEMADAAVERGYQYIGITDHSKGLKIAGGIDEEQLRQQGAEIVHVNETLESAGHSLCVLRSIEVNLNPSGEVDMEEIALSALDLVLGCFHSSLRKKEDQTERYLAALRNPAIQILGHPQGRIYNFRRGLIADWSRVFDLAAQLDKAVEIDSYPDRQDVSHDLVKLAKKAGCRISLGTDSHGPSQLRFIDFGLAAAITAGIERDKILNFMPRDQLLQWAGSVRDRAAVNK